VTLKNGEFTPNDFNNLRYRNVTFFGEVCRVRCIEEIFERLFLVSKWLLSTVCGIKAFF
jgi:hypothetical protein